MITKSRRCTSVRTEDPDDSVMVSGHKACVLLISAIYPPGARRDTRSAGSN